MCRYELKWYTASGCSVHNLLRDDILNELGINRDDIVSDSIQPSISTPTHPYVVPGLANPGHELCISGGISFQTKNGNTYQSEELYYKDDGHRRRWDRLFGVHHYNCEIRLTNESGDSTIYNRSDPIIMNHVISSATYIKVEMPRAGDETEPLSNKVIIKEWIKE